MEKIKITMIPNVKRNESTGLHIRTKTNERLSILADQMEIGIARLADYLLNIALDNVELEILGGNK